MGLDMYLYATEYVGGWNFDPDPRFEGLCEVMGITPTPDSPSFQVDIAVGYWRKQNAIHNWFVQLAGGVDECQRIYVSHESLVELRDTCKSVLESRTNANELLPTVGGFFFGATNYDSWYFLGLMDTVAILESTFANPNLKNADFYYQASW